MRRRAAAASEAADDTPELFVSAWALSELVEAAVRNGDGALAAGAVERLTAHAGTADGGWERGLLARGRALLAEGAAADALYGEALTQLRRTRLRPELARTHLLYGEWLRREGRRVEAREQLRAAHVLLTAIGMDGFAERARRELVATGERSAGASRSTRRADAPGAADRVARARGPVQPGDRRAAVPQPAHGRVAPAQGVRQAVDQRARRTARRAPGARDQGPSQGRPGRDRRGPGRWCWAMTTQRRD